MCSRVRRVLVVEPDQQVAEGLRRSLRIFANAWELRFVEDAQAALALGSELDAMVCDAALPDIERFLFDWKARFPHVARTVMAGAHVTPEALSRLQALSHQLMRKPMAPVLLFDLVERTVAVMEAFTAPRLQTVVGQLGDLPPLPATYSKISQMSQDPDVSLDDVSEVVEKDVAMTAAVLRIINSAYFGLPRRVSSVREAVRYLGIVPLKNLVLTVEVFEGLATGKRAQTLQQEALLRAYAMRELLGRTPLAEQAFIAGILADVGRLLLLSKLPIDAMAIDKRVEGGSLPWEVEVDRLGCSVATIGAQLLERWNLPGSLVEAVALHHQPPRGIPAANVTTALCLVSAVEWYVRGPEHLKNGFRKAAEHLLTAFPATTVESIALYFGQSEQRVA